LRGTGSLEVAGGEAFIAALLDGVPKAARIETYAREMRHDSRLRELSEWAERVQEAATRGAPPGEISDLMAQQEHWEAQGTAILQPLDLAKKPDLPKWLIRQLVPAAGRLLIAGQPEAGKSLLAQELAVCVATGLPALGVDYYGVSGPQGPAVVVDEESPPRALYERFEANFASKGLSLAAPEVAERLRLYSLQGVSQANPETWAALAQEVRRLRPALVVLDAAIRMINGSDNEAETVSGFWRGVSELQREGAAVVVVHHAGWMEGNRPRGSIDWRAGCDVELDLRRNATETTTRLSWGKVKDGHRPEPIWLEMEETEQGVRLRPTEKPEDEAQSLCSAVVDYLAESPNRLRTAAELGAKFNPGGKEAQAERKRYYRALGSLQGKKLVEKTKDGSYRLIASP
jgi:hypothetical protein